ncbi:hypothetical protein BJ165DRAFT_331283 [Panaeolus papilionaceus]|nr:hypothetical protein BJ165DRAFT_331283 [Panaeolus papilionaceus]
MKNSRPTASIADVAWVHCTTELLPDVTIRRINGQYVDGGRHHSLSFIVVLGVPPSLYYQKFSEQVGKGSENMHLWNACGDSVSQTLVAKHLSHFVFLTLNFFVAYFRLPPSPSCSRHSCSASTLNIDPNSAWLCILSLMHSTNRFMRSRPKRIGELWLSDLWVHYSFCRRSSSCLHHHLYHRHLHNDGHARETLQGRLLVDKWCGEASALEGCREDVVGLVGRDGGLLKMEEREEVVTILGKAFEASGWRV